MKIEKININQEEGKNYGDNAELLASDQTKNLHLDDDQGKTIQSKSAANQVQSNHRNHSKIFWAITFFIAAFLLIQVVFICCCGLAIDDKIFFVGLRGDRKVKIFCKQWEYFRSGGDHIVFKNINKQSQLFQKMLLFSRKQDQNTSDQFLLNKLKEQIKKNSILIKHIAEQTVYQISESDREVAKNWLSQHEVGSFDCPKTLMMMDDLIVEQKWDLIIEFKPRNPMPEKYSVQTIEKIADKIHVDKQTILEILQNSDPKQKTHWYKRLLLKGDSTANNPLNFYNLDDGFVPTYLDTSYYSKVPKNIDKQKYNKLINDLFKTQYKQVFDEILRNMISNKRSMAGVWSTDLESIPLPQKLDDAMADSTSTINQQQLIKYIIDDDCLDKNDENLSNHWQQVYNYLVFFCWNDASAIIKINLNNQGDIIQHDLKLLDTYLKPIKNLPHTIGTIQNILTNYIKLKVRTNFRRRLQQQPTS